MADQQLTTREKRQARIAQLEARLQKEKARMNADKRKERNGQLIAFGIYLEEFLKAFPAQRQSIKNSIKKHLTGRNLERALAGWERIAKQTDHQTGEMKKKDLEKIILGRLRRKFPRSRRRSSPQPKRRKKIKAARSAPALAGCLDFLTSKARKRS